jgi:iron complex transport system substrate-binding protein
MEHMQENLSEQNRIDQLARMIGVSDDWLILRFKERTGLTPYQYLQRLRLDKAAAMLTSTDLSLSVIAEAVGYASGSHLSNLLKRKTGRRPEDYRATARRPMASH